MTPPKQTEVQARHIISKSNLAGPCWTVNPYIGCLHGCVYCYACFMRRFTGHLADQWGEFVDVKTNGAELFPADFRRVKAGDSVFFGSVTDAYQPLEQTFELTRGMLQFLVQEGSREGTRLDQISITILTKSDLVLRDLDLLKQIPNVNVGFSIALPNEKARRIFEPCASPIRQRLAALDILHREGIQTFAFMGPILPHITPVEELFEQMVGTIDSVFGEGLNTKCRNMPQILAAVRKYNKDLPVLFSEALRSPDYWSSVENTFYSQAETYGLEVQGFYRHDK